jgi:hypothetical protein
MATGRRALLTFGIAPQQPRVLQPLRHPEASRTNVQSSPGSQTRPR